MRARRASQPASMKRAQAASSTMRARISGMGGKRTGAAEEAPARAGIEPDRERVTTAWQEDVHGLEAFERLLQRHEPGGIHFVGGPAPAFAIAAAKRVRRAVED